MFFFISVSCLMRSKAIWYKFSSVAIYAVIQNSGDLGWLVCCWWCEKTKIKFMKLHLHPQLSTITLQHHNPLLPLKIRADRCITVTRKKRLKSRFTGISITAPEFNLKKAGVNLRSYSHSEPPFRPDGVLFTGTGSYSSNLKYILVYHCGKIQFNKWLRSSHLVWFMSQEGNIFLLIRTTVRGRVLFSHNSPPWGWAASF